MFLSTDQIESLTESEERFHFIKYANRLRQKELPIHEGPLVTFYHTLNVNSEADWANKPPPKEDWFTREVFLAVKKYASQSFYNYVKAIRIGTCSTYVPKQRDTYSEIKNMIFRVEGGPKQIMIPVSFKRDSIEGNHIVVYLNGLWQPLTAFLDMLHPSLSSLNDSQQRKNLCQTFWKTNRMYFRFLHLPGELRDIIYKFALGPSVEPGAYPRSTGKEQPKRNLKGKILNGPNRALLVSCKQVCREMLYVLSQSTVFTFSRLVPANKFFTGKASLRHQLQHRLEQQNIFSVRPRIKHVKLCFPHDQFLRFFGAQLTEEKRFHLSHAAASLQALELDSLELEIQHPYVMQHCEWLNDGCHETVVGWILDAAFPYVKNFPVRLTGCLKDSVKAAFYERLETARHVENAGLQITLDHDDYYDDLIIDRVPMRGGGTKAILRPVLVANKLYVLRFCHMKAVLTVKRPPPCRGCRPGCNWYILIRYDCRG